MYYGLSQKSLVRRSLGVTQNLNFRKKKFKQELCISTYVCKVLLTCTPNLKGRDPYNIVLLRLGIFYKQKLVLSDQLKNQKQLKRFTMHNTSMVTFKKKFSG